MSSVFLYNSMKISHTRIKRMGVDAMKAMYERIRILMCAFVLIAAILLWRLCQILTNQDTLLAGYGQGSYVLEIPVTTGTVYDRKFSRLTNTDIRYYAIVHPSADAVATLFTKVKDLDALRNAAKRSKPFFCEVTDDNIIHPDIRVIKVSVPHEGIQLAQHLIGYRKEGEGVTGLEFAYNDWLRSCDAIAKLECTVNATGVMLPGLDNTLYRDGGAAGGIITTLDAEVQSIAEAALAKAEGNGAAVVLDIHTGEIVAMASLPVYDPSHLADYLDDINAPFMNRALAAYSVGSVFKLVIASAALEEGLAEQYMYTCTGKTQIYGQVFRCHTHRGHGLLDLQNALTVSCNPYFVSLGRFMTPEHLVDTAKSFGFGQGIVLADGIRSAAGNLQTAEELEVEAEKANFCFGQGKLLATPLQVAAMTACIANDGVYITPRILLGMTEDGESMINATVMDARQAVSVKTAKKVQQLMITSLNTAEDAKGLPSFTTAGGKTSTAQTGKHDENGDELCNGWMTGFYPATKPRYAVTVMIENGGYGNQCAAPVFREIIDTMVTSGY